MLALLKSRERQPAGAPRIDVGQGNRVEPPNCNPIPICAPR